MVLYSGNLASDGRKQNECVRDYTVNNLSGFASLFANQCQPPANQCDIWFADTANQNMVMTSQLTN